MPDYSVHRYGTDTYGRPVLMTAYMHDWLEGLFADLGWRTDVAQGAFMARLGGGAKASDGAHDKGGCVDLRTKGLPTSKVDQLVRTARLRGGGAYRRDETARHGGMVQHCHITLGSDQPLSPMARTLWSSYVGGGDGLAGPGSDYEWRPSPLVLTPPEEDEVTPDDIDKIAAAVEKRLMAHLVNRDETPIHFDAAIGNTLEAVQRIEKKIGA